MNYMVYCNGDVILNTNNKRNGDRRFFSLTQCGTRNVPRMNKKIVLKKDTN